MSELLNPQLINLLACPDCNSDLEIIASQLQCSNCRKKYEIRNGIPCLYPSSIDEEHLQEEESLADIMKRTHHNKKDQFISTQWDESKKEFWGMVKNNVVGNNKVLINIGCGYDSNYIDHEKERNIFVNFDLVFKMLNFLQNEYGAKSCVAGDINKLPFKKASFDYVISIDVIHHESDNLKSMIKSFADLLKPGGTLFLEDPNAWGMFQIPKSILLPRSIYRLMRSMYHKLRQSKHRPADYEFPTNVRKIKDILRNLTFTDIVVYPNNSYPCIGPKAFQLYNLFSGLDYIRKYHNYHYMISAIKTYD
ncbi:MAG: methyltransferase domain-containing protein [Candidatus Krumholzibacteriota bacterium]|nr:methyltransferase domain-containing protein [Candidatus Krumholzibacteriota bacterium]